MRAMIDHIGIAVADLEEASRLYQTLGLEVGEVEVVASEQVQLRVVRGGETLIELLEATSGESAIQHFLAKRGPGLHHIALRVSHLEARLRQLQAAGYQVLDQIPRLGRDGTRVAFIHPRSASGVLLELVERPEPK
ncbi:MAG: methylmalonyl-CoA epimerase [Deinococcus sp.]|nr:methylmalonyl-CoA epimerase [Deinococcus sp.]